MMSKTNRFSNESQRELRAEAARETRRVITSLMGPTSFAPSKSGLINLFPDCLQNCVNKRELIQQRLLFVQQQQVLLGVGSNGNVASTTSSSLLRNGLLSTPTAGFQFPSLPAATGTPTSCPSLSSMLNQQPKTFNTASSAMNLRQNPLTHAQQHQIATIAPTLNTNTNDFITSGCNLSSTISATNTINNPTNLAAYAALIGGSSTAADGLAANLQQHFSLPISSDGALFLSQPTTTPSTPIENSLTPTTMGFPFMSAMSTLDQLQAAMASAVSNSNPQSASISPNALLASGQFGNTHQRGLLFDANIIARLTTAGANSTISGSPQVNLMRQGTASESIDALLLQQTLQQQTTSPLSMAYQSHGKRVKKLSNQEQPQQNAHTSEDHQMQQVQPTTTFAD